MSTTCNEFRQSLANALGGHPSSGVPRELAWHGHLLECAACRAMLEAEEALETVLATLPDPKLPPGLARRVLARLHGPRGDGLDRLLELDVDDAPPAETLETSYSTQLLASLNSARREAALDKLLERVPEPTVPVGLSERVLEDLVPVRRKPIPFVRLGREMLRHAALIIAALALGFTVWWETSPEEQVSLDQPLLAADSGLSDIDLELLQALDLLENWEILTSTDIDLQLAEIDSLEAELIEMEASLLENEAVPPSQEVKRG